MSGLYIHGASAFIGAADADADLLKAELRKYTPENFRRVNRFILLSLIGARKCVHGRPPAADTAIYLTTEYGNLGDTMVVLDEIYAARSLPKPFSFINTMSNTAAFYLAQNLGIRGRSIIVSSQRLSFERGLDLVTADFAAGAERSALIGGVDVASLAGPDGDTRDGRVWRMVDGSSWFHLRPERDGACGAFTENRSFRDGAACLQWIRERGGAPADVVAFGAAIGGEEAARWREALGAAALFDYLDYLDYLGDYGYSGSAAACGIAMFVDNFRGRTLFHINRDPRGSYALLEVEVF